jgi:hypothetical protein
MGVRSTSEAGRQTAVYLFEPSWSPPIFPADSFNPIRRTRFWGNTSLTGKVKAVTADMVKEGAVVIDVGVNRVGMTKEGKAILCGDVDFEGVKEKAGMITPVPGGVGPVTITMPMMNTVKAAKVSAGIKP